jgi:hypothetical protein
MNFVEALKITEGVFETYRIDQPKWWKRMDGTPILNDVAVRMAMAFVDPPTDQWVQDGKVWDEPVSSSAPAAERD